MKLEALVEQLEYKCLKGSLDREVVDIQYDSRKVTSQVAFLCISGTSIDAHIFIQDAVKKGASVIIVEKEVEVEGDVTVLLVSSTRKALAQLSTVYFGYPANQLTTIGITGTKGKTTTTYMIQLMLEHAGKKVGVIGTIGVSIDGILYETNNTTPESYELQYYLKKMVDAGCEYAIMEVSSQGLKMNRVDGFIFDYGIFTNLSDDHIGPNEHATMEEYIFYKSLLFQKCRTGIINADDVFMEQVIKNHTCTIQTYGFEKEAHLKAGQLQYLHAPGYLGISFSVYGEIEAVVEVATPGKFSVYNALAALMVGICLKIPTEIMLGALKTIKVKGRVEIIDVSDQYTILIDYAHNAMSVESLLTTLREYNPKRLISVFGCGGNRSIHRRLEMGEISGTYADLSVLTSDNPRFEDRQAIINDIKRGIEKTKGKYIEIIDRTEAIHYVMDYAREGDVIALMGKGHEDYIEELGKKVHYDEREIILQHKRDKR